jgi:hypothetical protein
MNPTRKKTIVARVIQDDQVTNRADRLDLSDPVWLVRAADHASRLT